MITRDQEMILHLLLTICHSKNFVDICGRTIAPIRRVIEVLIKITTVIDSDVLVSAPRKPQGGAQTEHTGPDDDDPILGGNHVDLAQKRTLSNAAASLSG